VRIPKKPTKIEKMATLSEVKNMFQDQMKEIQRMQTMRPVISEEVSSLITDDEMRSDQKPLQSQN
jgi:hypothetical protein